MAGMEATLTKYPNSSDGAVGRKTVLDPEDDVAHEKLGNSDPALDAIQDGDYHDLLDQNGGPEGF